jgi:hypothetical protein
MTKPLRRVVQSPSTNLDDLYSHERDPEAWIQRQIEKSHTYGPFAVVVTIDERLGEALMAHNYEKQQRTLSKRNVNRWRQVMSDDEWELNGETIVMSDTGKLNNGQHRISACLAAGVSFRTFIVFGVTEASRTTLDCGMRRSTHDILKIAGYQYSSELAQAMTPLLGYLTNDTSILAFSSRINPKKLLAIAQDHPGITNTELMAYACRTAHHLKISVGPLAALIYLFNQRNPQITRLWIDSMAYGLNIKSINDPRGRLRQRLHEHATRELRMDRAELMAVFIKAWNMFMRGEETRSPIRYRHQFKPEPFPQIIELTPTMEEAALRRLLAT